MNSARAHRRSQRASHIDLECLDDRFVPSSMHAAIGAAAEAVADISVAQRHENHLARLEARHEKAVARHDLFLARREARYLAKHPNTIMPTSNSNSPGTLPANVGAPLQSLYAQYEAYESSGASGPFRPTGINGVVINGTSVGIQVKSNNMGDFSSFVSTLENDGMQVQSSSSTYGLVNGMLPISQLPAVAQLPETLSITPIFNPILNSRPMLD